MERFNSLFYSPFQVILLGDSQKISLSDEIWSRIKGFLPVVSKVMDEPSLSEDKLANLALWIGLEKMLTDMIGNNPELLMDSILQMNRINPEFIGNFIVQAMEKVETIMREEITEKLVKDWKKSLQYI